MNLTHKVKNFTIEHGADMVGIASAEKLAGAPAGRRPSDLLRGCKSVVVFAMRIPWGTTRGMPNVSYLEFGYFGLEAELNHLTHRLAILLEDLGYTSLPTPAGRDIDRFDVLEEAPDPKVFLWGSFSLRHAAVEAGLGGIGANSCLVTPVLGSRVRVGAVLTTAPLEPDSPIENPCKPEACGYRCTKVCPARALPGDGTMDHYRCLVIHPEKVNPEKAVATLKDRFKGPPLVLAAKMLSFTGSAPHTCAQCLIPCPTNLMKPKM